jgi:type I restriction enzyme M protein
LTQDTNFKNQTKELIDSLKAVCAGAGLGNTAGEFNIILQSFLYKFLNDKFSHELKKMRPELAEAENFQEALEAIPDKEYQMLTIKLNVNAAFLRTYQTLGFLFNHQNEADFAKRFDDTLIDIAASNSALFAVSTEDGQKLQLFEPMIEKYVSSKRDAFAKAIINKMVESKFNFEYIMNQGFDFFSTIFEYLIKDYNSDSGGKYAEYYTPHAVSKIMATILAPQGDTNVSIFDPSAGSGTLLMNLAHAIGSENCTVYSQDISQKSSNLLRLNLVLNGLVHSIGNVIQGNTMTDPYHKDGQQPRTFDYIVANPPFKLDFSEDLEKLGASNNKDRFFAGLPNVPKKAKDKMAIYPLFIQHIMFSLSRKGKAAIVVPTGFITAQSGIEKRIREKLVADRMLAGVVSMPSNIFATTGTNVSILFLDKNNKEDVVLIDASNLGTTVKEGKNQKTVLSDVEEQKVIQTFVDKTAIEDFSVVVSYDEIAAKNYSLSAGQYFEVKIEYIDITADEFATKMSDFESNLENLFAESKELEKEIQSNLKGLRYE